jgi:hypothetical protein
MYTRLICSKSLRLKIRRCRHPNTLLLNPDYSGILDFGAVRSDTIVGVMARIVSQQKVAPIGFMG